MQKAPSCSLIYSQFLSCSEISIMLYDSVTQSFGFLRIR